MNVEKKQGMDDADMDLGNGQKLHRVYDYLPYTHWQIKRLLKQLGMHLEPIGGYKCNRVPNYKQHYQLVEDATGRIVNPDITNDAIRKVFARLDIPMDSQERSSCPPSQIPNPGAKNFRQSVLDVAGKEAYHE